MKRYRHISMVLAALVLFANMGLALNVHYCHDNITSLSFSYTPAENASISSDKQDAESSRACCKKAVQSGKKCCKDHVLKVKDTPEKAIVKSFQLELGFFYLVQGWRPSVLTRTHVAIKKDTPSFYCPGNGPPRYKLYCQYVLYA